METLIKQYRENFDFTNKKFNFFVKPSTEVLNMIKESDDFKFRKDCINAFLENNPDAESYIDFLETPVIKQTMNDMLVLSSLRDSI
jgi:hypothetical protein